MELKNTLKYLLRQRNVKISELARATKVPPQTISNWIYSSSSPKNLKHLISVANFFQVSLDYLITGKQKEVITELQDEINAGVFEVVLRRPKKNSLENK